ncbi:MAG: hypothetical protein COB23_07175 [Methylophaga sp.]|nr:MAG: hypothetical protein COB23_07175 [Methylophaga sp.]
MIAFEEIQQTKKNPRTDESNKGSLLNNLNDTPALIVWQRMVLHTQELAITMPDVGINLDALVTMSVEQLKAIHDFLMGLYVERENL